MAGENSSSAHSQSFHVNAVPSAMGLQRLEQCSSLQFTGDVQLARVPDAVTGASPTTVAVIGGAEKRKRGRPPRYQAVRPQPPLKRPREEEEDVCFICFDGGSLVLCDRKGCPKAYHPKCIKRDEAFFRSKAKWNCGWHICSVCQRASHYLCYTCTYSLCKACTKNTEYLCVRGNKGFCSMCMKTIMLIENKDQANKVMVQVDFDDKTSFEYLFKVYWVILKEKLSLTLDELVQAKNPWKESDAMYGKQQLMSYGYCIANGGNGVPGKSFDNLELKKPVELAGLSKKDPPITERRTIGDFNNVSNLSSPPQSELSTREIAESSNVIILSSIPPSEASKKDRPTTENCAIAESNSASFLSSAPNPELTKPVEKLELQNEDCSGKKQGSSTAVETSVNGRMEWASKELLDFVGHVKGGDTSAISQFDVQALLLDYIKRNNLRDPRRKSQILCDLRLKSLFGKPRVGHIEMLKLLEFHFLIKEESEKSAFIPAGIVGTVMGSVKPDVYSDLPSLTNNTRKRKTRKNGEVKMTQINLDGYAAIDAHNIKSIYLRRDLMENLVEDVEKFRDRVIGSVVRIRLPGNDQKQEIYRLVHVVGTCKSSEPYKIRDKTVDVLLEVLNLDKKEAISIDSISNQDFCEDECRRLRQSIKCGFVKRPTVGEIQKKAIELMAIKLNDSLEAEILRLNHLRDRASEKGHKKELRECIEKLELLKTPGERQRRLLEIPEVHADPKMDPTYGSDGDDGDSNYKRKVGHPAPRYTRIGRRGEKFMPSGTLVKEEVSTVAQSRMSEKREACGTNILDKLVNRLTVDQAVDRSGSETSVATLSTANSSSAISSETEKMWHYRDPAGNIQGPFCVIQLRKWNTSGLFPPDMRIWTNHEHDDSVLLTNVLKGLYHKSPPQLHRKPSSQPQETASADSRHSGRLSDSVTGTGRECGEREAPGHLYNGNKRSNPNTQYMKGLDLSKGLNSSSDKPQPSIPVPSPSQLVPILALPHQERGHENDNRRSVADHVTQRSRRSRVWQKGDGYNHTNTQSNGWNVGQSSGRNQSSDSLVQKGKMEVPNLPSPTPETSYGELEADAAEKLLLLSSVIPVCGSDFQDLRSPTISHHEAQGGHASENIESPVPESGHKSRSSANHEAQGGHAAENIESSVQLSGHKSRSNVNHEAQGGHAAENIESPVQESGDKSRSNANHEAQGGYAAKIKESFVRESDHRWSNANHEAGGHVANNESPVRESGHRWNSADHEAQGGHAAEIKEFFVEESGHGCSNANHEAGEHVANKGSPVPELGHRWSSADNEAQGGHAAEIKESFVRESCRGCSNANHEAGGHVANEESPIRESGYRWSSENHEAQGGHAAETKESFVQESGHGWSNANQETGGYATNKESPVLELGHRWINANHEGQGGHAAEAEESFVQESSHGWSNANQEAGGYAANKESPVLELGHRWINANHEGQGGRAAEINESSPVQESGHRWSNANNEAQGQGGRAAEINESSPSDPPAQDSGPSNAYLEPHFGSATENKDPFPSNLPPVQESGPSNANHEGRGGHAAEIKESVLSNLPVEESVSRWSNAKHEAQGAHAAESKGSFPSGLPVQESGHRWSSASSLVIDGAQLREIGDEEWDSGILSISPLKSGDAVVDEVATPITTADQLNHSSPAHPLFNFFSEPIEFSTLAEESVSDLLAEVDAMESQNQNGMGSPTSAMRCGLEMMPGCRNDDYFSPIDELSLAHNPVKSDALSSTGDLQLPCQSTLTNVAAGASRADAFDVLKRSGGNSSTSSEGETKSTDVLFSHGEAGSNIPATCTTSQNAVFSSTIGRSTGFGVTNGRGTASIPNWAGPVQGYANVGLGGMGTSWGNSHMSFSTPFHGNPVWDNQRRYTVGRSGGPRDWALQGGDSGFGRGRSSLNNRQQPYGSGGYSRQSPKGQRICKFYESGRCKKGAMCDYLHP